jgi:hypothetical protein
MPYPNRDMPIVRARSYHAEIARLRGTLSVQAVFASTLHLRHSAGWILTVGRTTHDGPLGVRLEEACGFPGQIAPGTPARLTASALRVGTTTVWLEGAVSWEPTLDSPAVLRTALERDARMLRDEATCLLGEAAAWTITRPTVVELAGHEPLTPPAPLSLKGRGGRGMRSIPGKRDVTATVSVQATTFLHGRHPSPLEGEGPGVRGRVPDHALVFALLGRGPGLTPAGDDLLCGLLIGLHAFRRRGLTSAGRRLETLIPLIDAHARDRTTALSTTLLHYAARGTAVEPLLHVAGSIGSDGGVRGVEALTRIGHTSGRDMLAGILVASYGILGWERADAVALDGPS